MLQGKSPTQEPNLDQIFSISALRRAWLQVRRNGKSSGSDGMSSDQFEQQLEVELNKLRQQVLSGTYRPQPVRRYFVKKASGGERPISIWAIRDRVLQRVVADLLMPSLELMFLDCSYGFRPGRSVQDAVKAVTAARDRGFRWVLDADIQDCFGSIDLSLLMGFVRKVVDNGAVIGLIDQWLKTPIEKSSHRTVGVSQGGVISPLLANLYLHHFDLMLAAALPKSKLVRFADDFVVLNVSEIDATWSLEVTQRSLTNIRLKLNPAKTRVTHFDRGFSYLGVAFKGLKMNVQDEGEHE